VCEWMLGREMVFGLGGQTLRVLSRISTTTLWVIGDTYKM